MRIFANVKQEYQHRKKSLHKILSLKKKKEEIESKVVRVLWEEVQKSFAVGVNDAGEGRGGGGGGGRALRPILLKIPNLFSSAQFSQWAPPTIPRDHSSPKHLYSPHCTITVLFDSTTKKLDVWPPKPRDIRQSLHSVGSTKSQKKNSGATCSQFSFYAMTKNSGEQKKMINCKVVFVRKKRVQIIVKLASETLQAINSSATWAGNIYKQIRIISFPNFPTNVNASVPSFHKHSPKTSIHQFLFYTNVYASVPISHKHYRISSNFLKNINAPATIFPKTLIHQFEFSWKD